LPNDDFWNRVNEELAANAEREPNGPSRAAPAGPPSPAAAGDLWSRPADRRSDELSGAGEAGPGGSAARDQWSAWAPSVSSRPGSPSAGDEDEPRDRADWGTADKGAEAGTLGPLFAWRDAEAGHAGAGDAAADLADAGGAEKEAAEAGKGEAAGAGKGEAAGAGKEAADAEKEADAKAAEPDEEEEAAPSPWSIPLTLVGDLNDPDEEDGGRPADAEDGGTAKPPVAGEKPAPERAGSDVWTRPSWASTEEKRAGSARADSGSGPEKPDEADRADAARGPWLTRPGMGATAGRDSGDAAATRAGDKADAPDAKADADDDARRGQTASWGGRLPSRVGRDDPSARAGRDEGATPAGGEAGADDQAKTTPAGRDSGADDPAKATGAGQGDGDAASRTRADTDAGAAADTPPASAGSASGTSGPGSGTSSGSGSLPWEARPGVDGEAEPPSAAPTGKAPPVGRPSAALFEPASRATPGSSPDPVPAKVSGPGTQREAPEAAEGAGDQRAPGAGSGTGAGQTGATPATARDDDARGAAERGSPEKSGPEKSGPEKSGPEKSGPEKSGPEKSGPTPALDGDAVVIVPGVARYHRTGCILIRFLGGDDLETLTAQAAEAKGCAPCRACEPDKPLSSRA
jgi:hypothetical protein